MARVKIKARDVVSSTERVRRPKPVTKIVRKIPVNLDEITSIHSELVKAIPGGGTVETRHLIAARLWAVIQGLR